MARIDALCLFSDAQAVTTDVVSTNVFDCGNVTPKRQIGTGVPLAVTFQIDVSADFTTGDETYEFQVIQSAADTMSTPTIIAQQSYIASGVMISTLLVAGYIFVLPIPPGYPLQRYISAFYNTGGNTPTMTVTAWLGRQADAPIKPQTYANAYNIG